MTNNDMYAERGSNGFRVDFEAGPHQIWTMWQDYWDHDELDKEDLRDPFHYDGNLDRIMSYGNPADRVSWDFRMEYEGGRWGYPTVREVLSNDSDLMSVRYMNDRLASMIPGYQPNRRLIEEAERDVGVQCNRDWWRRLKNGDADEEELLGPIEENTLRGQLNTEHDFLQTTQDANIPASCQQQNSFTLQEDRDEWDRLCRELPENTTVAERFALLAEKNCERRGNPRKDEIPSKMFKMMSDFPDSAFECFHRPQAAI
ncbi:MAG: hypothetical protein SGARI_006070 [Bacillariaceae sp.]